ncbi:MFS transporter [Corynebacterium glutamicum]|uniref:MFS transporter n=1 Tax=Corynebacterium glutamicum TaxID=1718 RepID=UPI00117EC116|nr:MFS transporter [Corynebacterium glutamicum]QDQ21400.1 MFS transporter [Corynebacterium glutamicum]QDQ22439.1 MFS transporter [Corynebacterium glutamicum]
MKNNDQRPSPRPHPREKVTTRALIVWAAACLVYMAAITSRTSFGVAGVEAIDRFQVDATRIAVFTSVQVGVYAFAQIPMGILIDKFGPRKLLAIGALVMGIGQLILGFTDSYSIAIIARVFIGAGDASIFLSVMRILPFWFPLKHTPIFTQLTTCLGQLGQFFSAVPFMALLGAQGWTVAFVSLGSVVALIAIAALVAVRDTPDPQPKPVESAQDADKPSLRASLKLIVRNPITWQGFFIHYVLMVWQTVFSMMWGVPLMTLGMGLSATTAGLVLSINTLCMVVSAPIIGIISARLGYRRDVVAIALSFVQAAVWLVFLASDAPRGLMAIILVNIVMGLTTAASGYGFDTIRERLDRKILAAGTGLANMGGFLSSMVAAQVMGFLLDHSAHGSTYTWVDFRFGFLAILVTWAVGVTGFVVARLKGGPGRRLLAQIRSTKDF